MTAVLPDSPEQDDLIRCPVLSAIIRFVSELFRIIIIDIKLIEENGQFMETRQNGTDKRYREIIKYNITGIVINLFLSFGKLAVGLLTHAHAVILDGIEGFSDLISAVFTIFSAKIGAKKADKEHPFGYGRMEYLMSILVTLIIMFIGLRSIFESIRDIIDPHEAPDYNLAVVLVMSVSLAVKLIYGIFLRKKGREITASALIMTGTDYMGDALNAAAILAAILIEKLFSVDIEHYLCIAISLMIIHTGIQMLRECVTKILGTSVDPEFKKRIKTMIIMEDGVYNVSNLVIHNYGESVYVGSVDIEVDKDMRAGEIGKLSRTLIQKADELGLTLTAVGISGTDASSPEANRIWDEILDVIRQRKNILRANSFAVDFDEKQISFSIVPDPAEQEKEAIRQELLDQLNNLFPDMTIDIQIQNAV